MKYIISTIKLTDEQLNTSFVDILYYKYNNLPKIGYSGTFDIALPEKDDTPIFTLSKDLDEKDNVEYALNEYKNGKLIEKIIYKNLKT